jgi:hypothetical protein
MKVFKTVQAFGNQLDNTRNIRMTRTVHFDADDDNHTEDEILALPDLTKNTRDVHWRDPSNRLAHYLTCHTPSNATSQAIAF